MAVTVGGGNANDSTSVTIPTHAVGNIIVVYAYNYNSTTAPTKPTAGGTVPNFAYIDNPTGSDSVAATTAYYVATAANHTSGTWGNTNSMIAVVCSGQHSTPIGGHAIGGGNGSSQVTAPAITLSQSDGTSAILEFYSKYYDGDWNAAPSGYTLLCKSAGAWYGSCCDYKQVTTTDGSVAHGTSGITTSYTRAAAVEILAATEAANTGQFFAMF